MNKNTSPTFAAQTINCDLRPCENHVVQEMALSLTRAFHETELDLGDWREIERWLAACLFHPSEINVCGQRAIERARLRVQREARLDMDG